MISAEEVDANYADLSAQIDRLEELEAEDREDALDGPPGWWARLLGWFGR